MATISGIRGMLLEEAILYLLRVSGYRTVEQADPHDTTLTGNCYSGLKVSGRGGVHQIDAIADMAIATPFTYAQRLLVEAKCYADTTPVRIEIVRNAVGVLKDVGEYWVTRDGLAALRDFCGTCRRVNAAFIAMIAGRFPIFLVPNPSLNLSQLQNDHIASIHWNRDKREKGWYLRSRSTGELLFSFDLPLDVFKYYAEQNVLSPAHALNLKEDVFTEIQAIVTSDNFIRII